MEECQVKIEWGESKRDRKRKREKQIKRVRGRVWLSKETGVG
jgi:hypothetical protein